MADLTSYRSNTIVTINVKYFDVKYFKMWSENTATVIGSLRSGIVRLMEGEEQPTGNGAATWGRANKGICVILLKAIINAGRDAAIKVCK